MCNKRHSNDSKDKDALMKMVLKQLHCRPAKHELNAESGWVFFNSIKSKGICDDVSRVKRDRRAISLRVGGHAASQSLAWREEHTAERH